MSTTYYRDDNVHINSAAIRVNADMYPLSMLSYVWHRRTGRLRRGGYMLLSRGLAVAVAVALIVAVAVVARRADFQGKALAMAGGILAVIVVLGLLAFAMEFLLELVDRTHEHGKGVHEIWVRAGDEDVMIYATTDSVRFGQIYRALQRAIESSA